MKQKVIEIEFPNGEVFEVSADIIAMNRTRYYSGVKGKEFKEGSDNWVERYNESIEEDKLYYWISKIMEWEEIKPHAKKIDRKVIFDYDSLWHDAAFILKDKDTTQRW